MRSAWPSRQRRASAAWHAATIATTGPSTPAVSQVGWLPGELGRRDALEQLLGVAHERALGGNDGLSKRSHGLISSRR